MLKYIIFASDSDDIIPSSTRSRILALAGTTAVAAVGLYIFRSWQKSRRLPPGPVGVPGLGSLKMQDQSKLHLNIQALVNEYGPLCSFYLGQQLFIAVCSYDLIKQMLEDQNFSARPRIRIFDRLTQRCGIIFVDGESWAKQRRISLRVMRDFGFARNRSIEMMHSAIDSLFEYLDEVASSCKGIELLPCLLEASNSVIAQLTFGQLFTRADKSYDEFYKASTTIFSNEIFSPTMLYPWLDYAAQYMPMPGTFTAIINTMYKFVREAINKRRAIITADPTAEPACLCDFYVMEQMRAEAMGDFETFKEFQLIRVCLELFLAGTDTTARSVEWLLLYMAFNPDVQKRVQSELDSVVDRNRRPELCDKASLHYTNAVIDEGYRMASLAAVGVFHRAFNDAVVKGYLVPSNAIILPVVYSVHRDPNLWQRPNQFWPEHFLDEFGHYKPSQHCIPFLIGKRECLGESLARIEVFMLFTSILQRFTVTPTGDSVTREEAILNGKLGNLMIPDDYAVLLSNRND